MPPPPSYIDITSVPFDVTVSAADFNAGTYGGVAKECWLRFITADPVCFGVHAGRVGTFNPTVGIYQSDGSTLVGAAGSAAESFYRELTANTFYVRLSQAVISDSDFDFNADAKSLDNFTITPGCFIVNDDANGPPATVLTPTGEILGFLSAIPGGESAAQLPTGESLWQDRYAVHGAAGSFAIFDDTVTYVASSNPEGWGGFFSPVGASDIDFYVVNKVSAKVYKITPAGVSSLVSTLSTGTPNLLFAFGVSNDGTIGYWAQKGEAAIIHQHDLVNDLPLADLYTAPSGSIGITANNKPGEILGMPDGSVVTWFGDLFSDSTLIHVSDAGVLLNSVDFSGSDFPFIDHICNFNSTTVALWRLNSDLDESRFSRIGIDTGTESPAFEIAAFQTRANLISDDPTVLGPSESCSMIVFQPTSQPATLTVIKNTVPAGASQSFDFTTTGGLSPDTFSLEDGESQTFEDLAAGEYGVTETEVPNWTTTYEVSNGDPHDAIELSEGDNVTVTVTNTREDTSRSGIYKVVPGKRNDTLWVDVELDETEDVKIPDPFFKTAFIGE